MSETYFVAQNRYEDLTVRTLCTLPLDPPLIKSKKWHTMIQAPTP